MHSIGRFSTLGRITIKTLRYYDEIGLLRPARVDPTTGYRYYAAAQLDALNRILVFKDLGFSLREGAEVIGPKREIYLDDGGGEAESATEIQFPINLPTGNVH
jgi:DNA-binding transcriptional MerR regulator